MKFRIGLGACLLLVSAVAAEDQGGTHFRFFKPIERAAAKEEEIVAFTLDSDIFAATRPGYPDLRILDDAQAEAPYQIEPEMEHREERSRQTVHTEIVTLRPEGNTLEVHLRLPKDSAEADGLTFATPLINYERKVRVSGSADGAKWTPLVADGIIFDYSRFMDVQNREIALPKNQFREFKVTIEDVTDEKESPFTELTKTFRGGKEDQRVERNMLERRPFRIDRIAGWHMAVRDQVKQAKTTAYPVVNFEAKDDAANKQTIVTVRTHKEPITRFTLATSSRHFSRHVVVEVPAPYRPPQPGERLKKTAGEWQQIAEATIFDFSFRDQQRKDLTSAIPERREEQYRIVIRNEDNPPLKISGVQAEGSVQRVLFLAQPGKSYRVLYGSETAETPKYEAATVLKALRQDNQPVLGKLGPQEENKSFGGEPKLTLRKLLNNWIFLGAAIGLMVVVLGWSLFRAGRRLENLPKE